MAEYMLHHTHKAEDCERMFEAYKAYDTPLKGKGLTFLCYGCPTGDPGEHGGFIRVEADDEAGALAHLPEVERPTTKAYGGQTESLDV